MCIGDIWGLRDMGNLVVMVISRCPTAINREITAFGCFEGKHLYKGFASRERAKPGKTTDCIWVLLRANAYIEV